MSERSSVSKPSSQPGDFEKEYWAAVRGAAWFDLARSMINVTGPDAAAFLHNLCSNDVLHLAPGTGCEAFFATLKAKVVAHAFIYRADDGFWIDVAAAASDRLLAHLNRYLISEQAEIADRTHEFAYVHLAGPNASTILRNATGWMLPEMVEFEERRFVDSAPICSVRRHSALGLPGYDLLCNSDHAVSFLESLTHAGASLAGTASYDVLRIEAGLPAEGIDFDENTLIMELGRTRQAISYTKGCYLGQEPVVRARDLGHVNRTLLGLKIAAKEPVKSAAKLTRGRSEVGHVTSSAYSPRLESAIALAYIRRGNQEPGTTVEIVREGTPVSAEVSPLPIVPPLAEK
jgi:folate-binding protein YgfZ